MTTTLSQKKVKDALKHKLIQCPVCGKEHDFEVLETIVPDIPDVKVKGALKKGRPLVQVVCRKCYHVMLFDAHSLGVKLIPG